MSTLDEEIEAGVERKDRLCANFRSPVPWEITGRGKPTVRALLHGKTETRLNERTLGQDIRREAVCPGSGRAVCVRTFEPGSLGNNATGKAGGMCDTEKS